MTARRTGPMLRSVDLGSQRRSRPLVCSLAGCCQGERGSQKYTVDGEVFFDVGPAGHLAALVPGQGF